MNLKIAICDDLPQDAAYLHTCLEEYEIQYDIDFQVSEYSSSEALLTAYHNQSSFDILFLDVELPYVNGIELAKYIRCHKNRSVMIVFVSNYPRYMQDSFEVHPFYYLTKPLQKTIFQKVMTEIIEEFEASSVHKLVVENGEQEVMINIHELLYIEALQNKKGYISFITEAETIQSKGNLKEWEQKLVPYHFVSCHRGILVNLNQIHYITRNSITLKNGAVLPLSRRREKELRDLFSKRILILAQK